MADADRDKLGSVIDRFYEAAVQPELWRTVLHEASLALGAEGCRLTKYQDSRNSGGFWSQGVDELAHRLIHEGWAQRNPRAERALPLSSRKAVFTEADLFTPEELDELPFNAELVGRLGFRWFAGALLARSPGASTFLIAERRREQGAFSSGEISAIERLAPHLQRAAQLALRLRAGQGDGMLDAFEQMGCGGILIDFLGRALRLNGKARRHVGNGIALACGQVTASERGADASLQRLIGSVLRPGAPHDAPVQGAVALPRRSGRPLILHAAPIVGSAEDVFQHAKAILMLVDPDELEVPLDALLRQAFGLTRSEAQIAIGLAQGLDLQEVAATRGISLGTTRVQLKNVFVKTDTHRQADLVALMTRIAVVRGSVDHRR